MWLWPIFLGSRSQLQRNKKYYLTMLTPPQEKYRYFLGVKYLLLFNHTWGMVGWDDLAYFCGLFFNHQAFLTLPRHGPISRFLIREHDFPSDLFWLAVAPNINAGLINPYIVYSWGIPFIKEKLTHHNFWWVPPFRLGASDPGLTFLVGSFPVLATFGRDLPW